MRYLCNGFLNVVKIKNVKEHKKRDNNKQKRKTFVTSMAQLTNCVVGVNSYSIISRGLILALRLDPTLPLYESMRLHYRNAWSRFSGRKFARRNLATYSHQLSIGIPVPTWLHRQQPHHSMCCYAIIPPSRRPHYVSYHFCPSVRL